MRTTKPRDDGAGLRQAHAIDALGCVAFHQIDARNMALCDQTARGLPAFKARIQQAGRAMQDGVPAKRKTTSVELVVFQNPGGRPPGLVLFTEQ